MGENRERLRRAKALFVAASRLEGDERAAYLRRLSSEPPDVRDLVERLLAAEASSQEDDWLAPAPVELAAPINEDIVDPNVGRRIGPYELTRPLGTGGMGSVYLAARSEDYVQLVAIKLIKRGLDTDDVVRRFRNERQTLAALSHPGIARVLDGGTIDGLPYFVMEYVDGRPIDEHCAERELSIGARIRLLERVCVAVGHAHDNVVVHRDLKPANILVTAAGEPKLLDFGLARLLNPAFDFGRPDPTVAEHHYVTPAYASPEQLQGDTVGKPGDVYALGMILYELLADQRAYDLAGRSRREIERVVCFAPVRAPSAVASADRAGALRGDLDTIVLMALRKEPGERYADANALAADLRRWLEEKPIVARRESTLYVLGKLARRHRVVVASTLAVIIALALALVVSLVAMTYAFRQADLARKSAIATQIADARAREAERRADERTRASLSKKIAGTVLLDMIADPELALLLAIEAVEQSPTPAAEVALRRALVAVKKDTPLDGSMNLVTAVAFSADGARVVSVSADGGARVWDAGSGAVLCVLRGEDGIRRARFDPGGQRVIVVTERGEARVHDVSTGDEVLRLRAAGLLDALFRPDGAAIITSDSVGTLRAWDSSTGADAGILAEIRTPVTRAVFGPRGRTLVGATSDTTGCIVDVASGRTRATIEGHRAAVRGGAFDPEGTRIVTASEDETARVWSMTDGAPLLVLRGHQGPVDTAAFSPDGRWIVTVGDDRTIRVWDATDGACLRIEGGRAAAFSPNGEWLVVARQDDMRVLPWELFAPLAHNLRVARTRVTRELTPSERDEHVRELTAAERDALLRQPPPALETP